MNRPSRTDEPLDGEGYNQSPNPLSNDLTTNEDLNGKANAREVRRDNEPLANNNSPLDDGDGPNPDSGTDKEKGKALANASVIGQPLGDVVESTESARLPPHSPSLGPQGESISNGADHPTIVERLKNGIVKFGSFVGPGFMIAVAYSKAPSPEDAKLH